MVYNLSVIDFRSLYQAALKSAGVSAALSPSAAATAGGSATSILLLLSISRIQINNRGSGLFRVSILCCTDSCFSLGQAKMERRVMVKATRRKAPVSSPDQKAVPQSSGSGSAGASSSPAAGAAGSAATSTPTQVCPSIRPSAPRTVC
jgi:hypothetical protein